MTPGYRENFKTSHSNMKSTPQEASFRGLFNRSVTNARRRHIDWNISLRDFIKISTQNCFWCGIEPFERYNVAISKNGYTQRKFRTYITENGWVKFNGLDRISNAKGYKKSNVQPCCKYCNFARNDMTEDQFIIWINRIYQFQNREEGK